MEENNNKKKKMKAAKPKRGLWKPEEDLILKNYIETHGEGNWATVSKRSGLKRGGKSCRLRWKNYLRPNIKRGGMSEEEEDLIIRMHKLLGNRWSLIAGRLPGRTDNEVKNYWNTHLNKKRKTNMDSNNQHNDNGKKKARQSDDSQPILSTLTEEGIMHSDDKQQVMKEEEEEETSFTDTTWMERTVQCFNYDYDYDYDYEIVGLTPMMMNPNNYYSSMVFDEQPFTPSLDSFVLFEAFGTDSDV